MNFLAHAFLSGDNKDLIIGNFIADAVKGKDFKNYRDGVIRGILLHRKIDTFTDHHKVVALTKSRLRDDFGKYASVVSDIYYDHFLALHWKEYSQESLENFTQNIYHIIQSELELLPEEVKHFFPYMVKQNWLYNYQFFHGLERVFNGMSRRARFDSHMENGVLALKEQYADFEKDFLEFFPQLQEYVRDCLNQDLQN
ncbi:MAG TPA: acyl carrier protein phosphodiesterase [Cytophagaceae bacterium]|nr:acyl carrier protein phosphodiesterase [Cytophagaceae bacterium]